MKEGLNQGCPFSAVFAAMVLNRALRPLNMELNERAADRLARTITWDDGFGSVTTIKARIDDVVVPLVDLSFFC